MTGCSSAPAQAALFAGPVVTPVASPAIGRDRRRGLLAVFGLLSGESLPSVRGAGGHARLSDPADVLLVAVAVPVAVAGTISGHQCGGDGAPRGTDDHTGHRYRGDGPEPVGAVAPPKRLGCLGGRTRLDTRNGCGFGRLRLRGQRLVIVVFTHADTLTLDPVARLCGSNGLTMTTKRCGPHAVHSRHTDIPVRLGS